MRCWIIGQQAVGTSMFVLRHLIFQDEGGAILDYPSGARDKGD